MLTADPRLPHLALAWSSDAMAEILRDRVVPRLLPGAELTGVDITDMTYSPGRTCFVLYALDFGTSSGDTPGHALVTFAKDDRLSALHDEIYGDTTTATGPATVVPEYRCLVELWPADFGLPTLAGATSTDIDFCSTPGRPAMSPPTAPISATPEVLHYCPHRRCVLRYPNRTDGGGGLVAKLYPTADEASLAWRNLNTVFRIDSPVPVPAPVALVDDLHLLLMDEAGGEPLDAVLARGTATTLIEKGIRDAAAGLGALHEIVGAPLEAPTRSIPGDIAALRDRNKRMHLVAEEVAARVDRVLHRLASKVGDDPVPQRLIHGDFKPGQLLVDHEHTHLVDFDRTANGDPALDVGNFMAQLRKTSVVAGQPQARELASEFLESYLSTGTGSTIDRRHQPVEALALTRLAVRELRHAPQDYNTQGPNSVVARLLDEAEQCSLAC